MGYSAKRLKEIGELVTLVGVNEAAKQLNINKESVKRVFRLFKENSSEQKAKDFNPNATLKKIQELYSEKELQAIANGGRILPGLEKVPIISFSGKHIKIGVLTDTHIGHQKFSEGRLFQAFEEFRKEKVDFITHSGDVCVPPGTLITTQKGFKPIEDIAIDDVVLSHRNRWQKVTKLFQREVDEELIHLHTDNSKVEDLRLTKNHPIYCTIDDTNRQVGDKVHFLASEFIDQKKHHLLNIKEDSIFKPIDELFIDKKSLHDKTSTHTNDGRIKINDNLFKIIGLFLGDGSRYISDRKGAVYFYLENKGKKNLLGEAIIKDFCEDNGFDLCVLRKKNLNQWIINSKPLTVFFDQFYNAKSEKFIPLWLLNIAIDQFKFICYGLVISDGTILKDTYVRINNTSLDLLKTIKLRLESSGIYSTMNLSRKEGVQDLFGKECNVKNYYELAFNNATCQSILDLFYCKGRSYLAKFKYEKFDYIAKTIITKQSISYKGLVYNIEVENDNSYIANGVIVHNCEGMSHRPGHIYELDQLGYEQQKEYAIKLFSQWKDTDIYAIDGNHDRWFIKSNGAYVVKDIDRRLENFHFIGHDEGDISLDGRATLKLWHGEDGNSYALSYRIQKIIESFSGGEKPSILLAGHTHKYVKVFERNITAISAGCIEAQTSWMRGKRIAAAVGFVILDVWVGDKGITKIGDMWYPFYT